MVIDIIWKKTVKLIIAIKDKVCQFQCTIYHPKIDHNNMFLWLYSIKHAFENKNNNKWFANVIYVVILYSVYQIYIKLERLGSIHNTVKQMNIVILNFRREKMNLKIISTKLLLKINDRRRIKIAKCQFSWI